MNRLVRTGAAVLAAGSLALAGSPTATARVPAPGPAISGGLSALGSPAVVALAVDDGRRWRACSATLLRPRVLLTAAHCLTRPGTNEAVRRVRVFPPGSRARVSSDRGPRRPAPARVVRWWVTADLARGTTVQPDDLAALLLDRDLGPRAFTRVADRADLDRWRAAATPVVHAGYGGTGGVVYSPVPQWVSLPLRTVTWSGPLGSTFSTSPTADSGPCAGDSGGPVYALEGTSALLIGTLAGASGGCRAAGAGTPASDLGFLAMGYLPVVNAALQAAGHPPIPAGPRDLRQRARNRDVTVAWSPPATGADGVIGYDVVDGTGRLVCQTATTTCSVPGLPDGRYAYSVRSRNAEGEGDLSAPGEPAVVASPPAPAAPGVVRVTRTRYAITVSALTGRTSAVVSAYEVRDQRGTLVCAIPVVDQAASAYRCDWTPPRGTSTVSVQALTEMGPSPVSAPSTPVRVR